ncbi:MAG: peptidoglycan/xylan/chitin deacetylase (PgdA/CDA1 family) [Saprospiraceae bacterium]|jgi:peptidoglycan/xylan/chitin deacetylase (PgdA/CDA1 family)
MKRTGLLLFTVLFSSQVISQDYTICKWYNDYQACIVQTYDDMHSQHITVAVPLLLERKMSGTLFVDYDWPGHITVAGGWAGLENAVDSGIEMANHTRSHASLPGLDAGMLKFQIDTFRTFLNDSIKNQTVNTFAYPYGAGMDDPVVIEKVKEHHIGARAAGQPGQTPWGWGYHWLYDFGDSDNEYYYIPTISGENLNGIEEEQINNALMHGGLMTVMWHGVSDITHAANLDEIVKYSKGKIWHANFRDALLYHRERKSAVLSIKSETITEMVLVLSDTLTDNTTFNHPLTIKLKQDGRTFQSIEQNGKDITFVISNDSAIFNAIPDGGDIILQQLNGTMSLNETNIPLVLHLYLNQASKRLIVRLSSDNLTTCTIINSLGQTVVNHQSAQKNYNLDLSHLRSGLYSVVLRSGNNRDSRLIVIN